MSELVRLTRVTPYRKRGGSAARHGRVAGVPRSVYLMFLLVIVKMVVLHTLTRTVPLTTVSHLNQFDPDIFVARSLYASKSSLRTQNSKLLHSH